MSKPLTIAILCDAIDTVVGGSYISAKRFAQGLADQGHKIVRCTTKFIQEAKKKEFSYAKIYELASILNMGPQHIRLAYTNKQTLEDIFVQEQVDIVYNIHPSITGRKAYPVTRKLHIPLIHHSHTSPQALIQMLPKPLQMCLRKEWAIKLLAWFYQRAEGVIFPTSRALHEFDQYMHKTHKIAISNGVDTTLFYPEEKKITPKDFHVVYIGRLDPEKNLDMLIEAFHLLQDTNIYPWYKAKYTIVGEGSQQKHIQQLCKTYKLSKFIEFTGKIEDKEKLRAIYQSGSVYVSPSLHETESMTTLEAMACGCPIIVSNSHTNAAQVFVQDNGYTFEYTQTKDLADKIYLLNTHHEKREHMRKASISTVSKFTLKQSIQHLEKFFYSFVK